MRHKDIIKVIILICLLVLVETVIVSGDTLHSDWVGTLDKSYELAWQQAESGTYNGYRTYFFLEYTYLMKGAKKYPTYCIEYYKKGPRGNSDYGKTNLINTNINKGVRDGIIEIIKNGYPNVPYPYGTTDMSEAYYATSAAIHVWTMYHGVDSIAGNNLGWFMFKDGFRVTKSALQQYKKDLSTKSTASGWHVMGPNSNDFSRRTWKAAMELLIDASEANVQSPYINIKKYKDAYLEHNNVIYEYIIESNYCTNLGIKLRNNVSGHKIEYTEEKNNSVIAKIYIPVKSVNSGEKYSIYAYGSVIGADDVNNYYYLYNTKGEYQTMVYLDKDNKRVINSSDMSLVIPELNFKTYYDLNYSGRNYIKDSDFTDINSISYSGDKSLSSVGNVNFYTRDIIGSTSNCLYVHFYDSGVNNCLRINTLLNSSVDDGFKVADNELLTFSCWIKSDVKTSVKLCFKNSKTIYESAVNEVDQWNELVLTIQKSDNESNILCLYTDTPATIQLKSMQLEHGNKANEYVSEYAGSSTPMYTEHKIGLSYGKLYNNIVPTRTNYVFAGWNTKKDGSGIYVNSNDIVSKGNQVLYAIWTTKDTYNVYFHYSSNGGNYLIKNGVYNATSLGYDVVSVPNNTEFGINMVAYRSGYEFIGWTLENNLDSSAEKNKIESVYVDGKDIHLYANFKKTHKVRFHYYDEKSGSEQIVYSSENYSYNNYPYVGVLFLPGYNNENAFIKIPKTEDYILKGWSVNKNNLSEIDYKAGNVEDVVMYDDYYAIYEKNVTVKFYDNVYDSINSDNHKGSSYLHENINLIVNMNYAGEIKYGEFKLPDFVCDVDNFEFYGWSDSRSFDGSICYYADEKGSTIQTDTDLKFYSLYANKKSIKFYDYNFNDTKQHLEKEIFAYEYMNYNGDTYKPDVIIQYPCPTDVGWDFDYWRLGDDKSGENKYYPEERYSIEKDVEFYAIYKKGINVACHYLMNDNDLIMERVSDLSIESSMDSKGTIISKPVILPEIPYFEDDKFWYGIGYSDVDNTSNIVTHFENTKYVFNNNCNLYAIYNSDIVVNYHDYSLVEDIPLVRTDTYQLVKTCDNILTKVSFALPKSLSSDVHEDFWWTTTALKDFSNIHYVNDEVTVDRNSDFYGWHSDVYELICNDLYNDEARKRVFESTTITGYNGRIYPGKIQIPEQGESNDYEKTEYWSLSEDIVADYWSDEFVNIYSDVEINAIYKKPVNVIYDANGGTFDNDYPEIPETKYIFYNITGNKRLPFFTADSEPYRSGYLFQYIWNTSADGTGQEYPYDESFTCENDLRLFAVWKPAGSPQMSVIDRYFFVGEKITYDDIVEKIIAKDEFGFPGLEKVKVISINDRRTDGLSNDEIADKIVADSPRRYNLAVRFITNGVMINKNYTIYIIDKANDINRLRYISDDFLDTFHIDSKWNYAYNFGKLVISLNKSREDSEFTYVITKEGVE